MNRSRNTATSTALSARLDPEDLREIMTRKAGAPSSLWDDDYGGKLVVGSVRHPTARADDESFPAFQARTVAAAAAAGERLVFIGGFRSEQFGREQRSILTGSEA